MNKFTVLAAAIATLVGSASSASASIFYFANPSNLVVDTSDVYLTSGSTTPTTGTLNSTDGTLTNSVNVPALSNQVITLPADRQIFTAGVVNTDAAFKLVTDQPVAAYLMNAGPPVFSNDVTNLLPVESLGTNYRVMTYSKSVINPGDKTQLTIVATKDNTTVTINPKSNLTTGQAAGTPFNVTLNTGEAILYESSVDDLTGSTVVASNPIAVFGGNYCTNVPSTIFACDHIIEQMFATNQWGKEFALVPTLESSVGNVLRVLANEDGTQFTYEKEGGIQQTFSLNAGEFFDFGSGNFLDKRASINSNKSILVGQFMVGQSIGGLGDPAFSLVPHNEQWLSQYAINVPTGYTNNALNIAIKSSDLASLTLNDSLLSATDLAAFAAIPGTDLVGGNISVNTGRNALSANSPFMLLNYGYGNFVSYFGIAGSKQSGGGFKPPEPPTSTEKVPEPASVIGLLAFGAFGASSILKGKKQAVS